MLPGMNGYDVCRKLRPQLADLWIIVLTARGQEVDRVRGLELGADDYVVKPFSLRELVARVKVGLRREGKSASAIVAFGDVTINLRAHRVTRRGEQVALTRKEFGILELLLQRPGE